MATRTRRGTASTTGTKESGYGTSLARAFGGAIFFSLPLLMTMEMWHLGYYVDRFRLALFLVVFFPILVGLSHYSGFEITASWREDVIDACVAYLVGFVTAFGILWLTGVLTVDMTLHEIAGVTALTAVPASVGATLAQGEFHQDAKEAEKPVDYAGELFFMLVGGIFFAFNLAPTEEMILIAFKATPYHIVGLAIVSLILMHAIVYAVEFTGQAQAPAGIAPWLLFLRWTVVGYAIALLASAYILWTFGRFDGTALAPSVEAMIVLAFPAALGAAGARLIL